MEEYDDGSGGVPVGSEMEGSMYPLTASQLPVDSLSGQEADKVRNILSTAQQRWLKTTDVIDIIERYEDYGFRLSSKPPNKPAGGSLFLFDRKAVRYFRKDGHEWQKKKDGKTVRETHEKLKVGNQDVLNCYYAHGEESDRFQRRCFWLLESDMNIVLVHYLNVPTGVPGRSKASKDQRPVIPYGQGLDGAQWMSPQMQVGYQGNQQKVRGNSLIHRHRPGWSAAPLGLPVPRRARV
mmetsp:Transcript_1928/g.6885  ORF Transcript_1928/g.6885 Transcript_1928/m.6885 type:complete len:237 (-) Transcript_1928:174-884(-)